MPLLNLEELTTQDLKDLDRGKSVIFFSVSPIEEHGPHLPLGVDAFTARYFSEQIAKKLSFKYPDWNFIFFPTQFMGSDTFIYSGSVEIRPALLKGLLWDCSKSLAKDGFKKMIFVSGHGGPRHLVVLEEIAAKLRWRYKTSAISASSKMLFEILHTDFPQKIVEHLEKLGIKLTDQEVCGLSKDYHAGMVETSIMMKVRPDLVRSSYREMKPAILSSVLKFTRNSGKKVGEGLGYLGSPEFSRLDVGQAVIDIIISQAIPQIEGFIEGRLTSRSFRSPFYYIPFFRTEFKWLLIFVFYIFIFGFCWWLMSRYLFSFLSN